MHSSHFAPTMLAFATVTGSAFAALSDNHKLQSTTLSACNASLDDLRYGASTADMITSFNGTIYPDNDMMEFGVTGDISSLDVESLYVQLNFYLWSDGEAHNVWSYWNLFCESDGVTPGAGTISDSDISSTDDDSFDGSFLGSCSPGPFNFSTVLSSPMTQKYVNLWEAGYFNISRIALAYVVTDYDESTVMCSLVDFEGDLINDGKDQSQPPATATTTTSAGDATGTNQSTASSSGASNPTDAPSTTSTTDAASATPTGAATSSASLPGNVVISYLGLYMLAIMFSS